MNSPRRRWMFVATTAGLSTFAYDTALTYGQQNPNDQTVFLNANDGSGVSSFIGGANWQASTSMFSTTPLTNPTVLPAGTAPTAGYAYVVTGSAAGTGLLRTPATGNPTFAGDSLTLVPYTAPSTNTLDVFPVPINFAGNTSAIGLSGTSAQTVTVNNLIMANEGAILDLATGTATVLGTINLVPAGTTLDGITTAVSGGEIDLRGNAGGIVLNAALTGTGTLRIFSSTGSSTTSLSLNSSNAGFTGTIQPDASVGSTEAASSPNPVLNINNPNALGSGTLLFAAYSPNNGFTTISAGPSLDNTTGSLETLNGTFTQQWNTNFEFKGTNNLNMGTGAVTVGNGLQLTVINGTLIEPGPIGGSGTIQLSGGGVFELVSTSQINGPSFNIPAGTTLGFSATSTTPAQYAAAGTFSSFNFTGGYLGVDLTGYAGTYNLSSSLSGSMGLRKVGAGTLLLSGANTYTGPTNVSTGTLQVGNASALAGTSNLQLPSGSSLDINGFSPSIPFVSGAGTVTNSTTTPGTITITAGGTSVIAAGAAGANGVSPAFTGVIANGSATTSLTIALPASGAFNISGSTNTYTGATTLSGGTLLLGASSLPAGNVVTFNGGALGFIAQPTNDPSLHATATAGNNYSFNVPSKSLTVTLAGALNGSAGLTLTGLYSADPAHLNYSGGTLVLSSTSSNYTGPTTVTGATLSITSPGGLGNTSGVAVYSPPANTSSIATTAGALSAGGTTNYTLGVPISGTGNFIKTGTNTVTLTATNTYTGTTNLSAGTLQLGNAAALASSGNVSIGSTATLDLHGYSVSLPSINGSGTVTNGTTTPVTLTITAGGTAAFSGTIANGSAVTSLTLAAPSSASFNMGAANNSYTGATTLTGGTLYVGANSLTANDSVVFNGGTLGFTAQPGNDPSTHFSVTPGNGYSFAVAGNAIVTLAGNLSDASGGPTSVSMNGTGTLILTGTSTYTGTTNFNGGVLAFGSAASVPPNLQSGINVSNLNASVGIGNNSFDFSFPTPVSGMGGITKIGSDAVTLTSTDNTYTGTTNVSSGTLVLGNANALGSTSDVNLGANNSGVNGTLDVNGFSVNVVQPTGGAPNGTNLGGVITNSSATPAVVTLVPAPSSYFLPNSSYFGTITGNLSVVVNYPAPTSNASPVESLNNTYFSNTYTGSTTLQSGVLEISGQTSLPTATPSIYFTGGILQVDAAGVDPSAGFAQTPHQQFSFVAGFNNDTVLASSLNSAGGSLTIGNINYGGGHAITLSGVNNFNGPTNVVFGELQLANPMAVAQTSGVTVQSYLGTAIGSTPLAGVLSINDSSGYVGLTGGAAGGAPINLTLNGLGPQVSLGYTFIQTYHPTGVASFGALQGTTNATVANPDVWAGNITLGGNGPVGISGGLNYGLGQAANAATGGALKVSGVISGTGPLVLGLNPLSTTILAAPNTYTGETQINSSTGAQTTVQLGANFAIPAASGVNFQDNPGANLNNTTTYVYGSEFLDLNGYNTSVAYLTSTTGTSLTGYTFPATNGVITNSKSGTVSTLTLLGGNAAPYLGAIDDGAGKVAVVVDTAVGATPATLNNSASNYSGGTTVNGGVLILGSRAAAGTGNITVNGGYTFFRSTTAASVNGLIATGLAGGAWNGPGINSTAAAADTNHLLAVGMLASTSGPTFGGQTLGPSDVVVALTYFGDANLDGKIDGSDYSIIDNSYGSELTTGTSVTGWYNGDFNYDGTVDASDYTLIDNSYNRQGNPLLPSALVASPTALSVPTSAVPEPAVVGLLSAGLSLGARRRK